MTLDDIYFGIGGIKNTFCISELSNNIFFVNEGMEKNIFLFWCLRNAIFYIGGGVTFFFGGAES